MRLAIKQSPGQPEFRPAFTAPCHAQASTITPGRSGWTQWKVDCDGNTAAAHWRLQGAEGVNVLVQVLDRQGQPQTSRLFPNGLALELPFEAEEKATLIYAIHSGVHHFLIGWDHLLFIIGLTLYLRLGRPLLIAVSAFTLGHALTLTLASLQLLRVPGSVAELAIAASLIYLAHCLFKPSAAQADWRECLAMPLGCGLLHGLGFANVLVDIQSGSQPLLGQLLGFNLGIELAQIACVLAVLAAQRLLALAHNRLPGHSTQAAAYLIGSLGCLWCLQRLTVL